MKSAARPVWIAADGTAMATARETVTAPASPIVLAARDPRSSIVEVSGGRRNEANSSAANQAPSRPK